MQVNAIERMCLETITHYIDTLFGF